MEIILSQVVLDSRELNTQAICVSISWCGKIMHTKINTNTKMKKALNIFLYFPRGASHFM